MGLKRNQSKTLKQKSQKKNGENEEKTLAKRTKKKKKKKNEDSLLSLKDFIRSIYILTYLKTVEKGKKMQK